MAPHQTSSRLPGAAAPTPSSSTLLSNGPMTLKRKRSLSQVDDHDENEDEKEQEAAKQSNQPETEQATTTTLPPPKVARYHSPRSKEKDSAVTQQPPSLSSSAATSEVHLMGQPMASLTRDGQTYILLGDVQKALQETMMKTTTESTCHSDLLNKLEAEKQARVEAEEAKEKALEEVQELKIKAEMALKMDDYAECLWFVVVERVFSKVKFAADETIAATPAVIESLEIMPDNAAHRNTFADACMNELATCFLHDKDLAAPPATTKKGSTNSGENRRRQMWMFQFTPPKSGASWCRKLNNCTLATVALKRLSTLRASFTMKTKKVVREHVQRLAPKDRIPFLSQLLRAAARGTDAPHQDFAVLKNVVLSRMCVHRSRKKFKVEYETSTSLELSLPCRQLLEGKSVGQFLTQSDEALIYASILNFVVVDKKLQTFTLDGAKYTYRGGRRCVSFADEEGQAKTARGTRRWSTSTKPLVKSNETEVPAVLRNRNGWTREGVEKFKSLLALIKKQRANHKTKMAKKDRPTFFTWSTTCTTAAKVPSPTVEDTVLEANHGVTAGEDDLEHSANEDNQEEGGKNDGDDKNGEKESHYKDDHDDGDGDSDDDDEEEDDDE